MSYRSLLKKWTPPGAIDAAKNLKAVLLHAEWEYIPAGWGYHSEKLKGWNLDSIADLHVEKWADFCKSIDGPAALVLNDGSREYTQDDLIIHNTYMTFAYACALAAARNKPLRLLDWGGGIGHYGKVAESLLPGVDLQYTCYDLPVFCDRGKKVYPEADFCETINDVCKKEYDFSFLSSSLWYDPNWKETLTKLMEITTDYLMITRMIFVDKVPSYIAIQRPYSAGYKTEYLCQVFNQHEIINFVLEKGFALIKEVFISNGPVIHKAPQQGSYKGFIFARKTA